MGKKKDFRVQVFKECIRIHPKDLARKIHNIEETSWAIFMQAHIVQEELKKRGLQKTDVVDHIEDCSCKAEVRVVGF